MAVAVGNALRVSEGKAPMMPPILKPLEVRLALMLGLGLVIFSIVAGIFSYQYIYRQQLASAASLQQQLVTTVQAQAEVAAFVANREIAEGVLSGLLANPIILAARIESSDGFKAELGSRRDTPFSAGKVYPLFSPIDHIEPIGKLIVVQDDDQVNQTAAQAAIFQIKLMLVQVLMAAIIVVTVLRMAIIKPIIAMMQAMIAIQPGSSMRLPMHKAHADDEIGLLSQSVNRLLDTAEAAMEEVLLQRNELERLATHDHLTGLPTLRLAEDRLQVACTSARRSNEKVALLFIDLDSFKGINDSYGHEAGDRVLKEVAKRLQASVRAEDTVARIGGDEFVVIFGGLVDASTSAQLAENLGAALARPMDVAGTARSIGASIGIALFPDHTGDVASMCRIADKAMYKVKKSGKGSFAFVDPETMK